MTDEQNTMMDGARRVRSYLATEIASDRPPKWTGMKCTGNYSPSGLPGGSELAFLAEYVIGPPEATAWCSVDEIRRKGIVGLYVPIRSPYRPALPPMPRPCAKP